LIFYEPIIQNLKCDSFYEIDVLRLDLIHKEISGNKWFKLKRNLAKARIENHDTVITFGGAFSNHIAATASACKQYGLNSVGIVRGEEKDSSNFTLSEAEKNGMRLEFVSRELYREKNNESFQKHLQEKFGRHYLIPEGGNNEEGVLGCTEIIRPDWNYDYIFCACGTATTYAGIVAGKKESQKIIGISVLKGENKLPEEAEIILSAISKNEIIGIGGNEVLEKEFVDEDCILNTYAFKGYAKMDLELIDFKNEFEAQYKIPLDHIYTTKLFYGVFDLISNNKLRSRSKILAIHSGGLQGNKGFEDLYQLTPNL